MTSIRHCLGEIFNHDFAYVRKEAEFRRIFFSKTFGRAELKRLSTCIAANHMEVGGRNIAGVIPIKGTGKGPAFAILAQLHGNEPAGLAGIALAMALSEAGMLKRDVVGVIGNPLAAAQYFEAWERDPGARQETRDVYRAGLHDDGSLRPDLNRIPVDFLARDPSDPHIRRAQELYAIGERVGGIADIHSARGNMVCITDHKRDAHLKHSPIRAVLTGLAEAISAGSSGAVTVQTLKTILAPLPNIECQIGIEAGTHESPESPRMAASFTLSLLYTLGFTPVAPLYTQENGIFTRYAARPKLTYADLAVEGAVAPDDRIVMAREDAGGALKGIDGRHYAASQYEEMEAVKKGQVVAVAEPSGALLRAPYDFSGIFFSKSAALYDRDPNVGPWPVAADKLAATKFCYPCEVSAMPVTF